MYILIYNISEENFALAYEPIPLSIKMETWKKMSKEFENTLF